MLASVASVHGSHRASGFCGARRAPFASVGIRCVVPIAVRRAVSAFVRSSGAASWTRRGRGARRARGLALPLMGGRAGVAGGVVANFWLSASMPRRMRAVRGSSHGTFAGQGGPNRAVNTDAHRRGFARAMVAGYLVR